MKYRTHLGSLLALLLLSSTGATAAETAPAAAPPLPKLPPLPAPPRVGEAAPDFELTDINGAAVRLSELSAQGKTVVLEWFSPACPTCITYYSAPLGADGKPSGPAPMQALHEAIDGEDLVWLCINSAAPGQAGSDPEENKKAVAELGIRFPLLLDPSGRVGIAYGARRTPTLAVVDTKGRIVYRGCPDDGGHAAPGGGTSFVGAAVTAARAGRMPTVLETLPFG
jgi:peroxiredoxin